MSSKYQTAVFPFSCPDTLLINLENTKGASVNSNIIRSNLPVSVEVINAIFAIDSSEWNLEVARTQNNLAPASSSNCSWILDIETFFFTVCWFNWIKAKSFPLFNNTVNF